MSSNKFETKFIETTSMRPRPNHLIHLDEPKLQGRTSAGLIFMRFTIPLRPVLQMQRWLKQLSRLEFSCDTFCFPHKGIPCVCRSQIQSI